LNSSALSGIFFKQAHTKVAGLEGDLQGQFLEKTVWGFQQETPAGARSGSVNEHARARKASDWMGGLKFIS